MSEINHGEPGVVGVELEGSLGWDQEQEVCLDVSHRLLHDSRIWSQTPVNRINAEGRGDGGVPLLLSQTRQESLDLLSEEETEPGHMF